MRYHLISETIDGSIKNIIQLKTLDNSLEYSQMFDALCDTPDVFQNRLVQALNSCGENMKCSPLDAFNKVLCASDDGDDDSRKKLYSWWRGVFEVLGEIDVPNDKQDEYNQKIDDLMAEILKTSSDVQLGDDGAEERENDGQMVSEEYENASREDEQNMLSDMKFAVGKIGEIANRVQELVNFVNPYCESPEIDEKPTYEENSRMKRINEQDDEWVNVDDVIGVDTHEPSEGTNSVRVTDIKWDADDPEDIEDLPTEVEVEIPDDVSEDEVEDYVSDYLTDTYGFTHNGFSIDDGSVDESHRESAEFRPGDVVYWHDPDDDIGSGEYTVMEVQRQGDDDPVVILQDGEDGSVVEALASEVEALDGVHESDDDVSQKSDQVKSDKKFKGDDGQVRTLDKGCKRVMNEMTIEQEINDCEQLLKLLWGQGESNLRELLESGIAEDDAILSTIEDYGIRNLTELNDMIAYDFETLLESLGADLNAWNSKGEIKAAGEDEDDDGVVLEGSDQLPEDAPDLDMSIWQFTDDGQNGETFCMVMDDDEAEEFKKSHSDQEILKMCQKIKGELDDDSPWTIEIVEDDPAYSEVFRKKNAYSECGKMKLMKEYETYEDENGNIGDDEGNVISRGHFYGGSGFARRHFTGSNYRGRGAGNYVGRRSGGSSSSSVITKDKLYFGKKPKTESQAVYFLFQAVSFILKYKTPEEGESDYKRDIDEFASYLAQEDVKVPDTKYSEIRSEILDYYKTDKSKRTVDNIVAAIL